METTFYFIRRNFKKKSCKDLSQQDFQNDDWNCIKKTLLPFYPQRVKGRLSESVWLRVFCMFLHTFKQELCLFSMDWIGVGSADTGVHHLSLIATPQWLSDQYFEAIGAGMNKMDLKVTSIWIIGPQLVLLFGQALQAWPWCCLSLEVALRVEKMCTIASALSVATWGSRCQPSVFLLEPPCLHQGASSS